MNPSSVLNRRSLFKATGLAAVGLGSCSPPGDPRLVIPERRFFPVKVSPSRVIRTIVGHRPFRPSGFVLRAEQVGSKRIVHNYGHGGCGVTLSWGTAHLAVEQAMETGPSECAVLGCGAVGLATARLLQRKGVKVTIYAKDLPPATTSNIAGAQWSPFTIADRDYRTPAFNSVLEEAARLSHRYFQDLTGDHYGVRWIENYVLSESASEKYLEDPLADLFPDTAVLAPSEHPFPSPHARRFVTMLIETPIYLEAVLRDFLLMGGRLVVREFAELSQLETLGESVIVNCTGMGSRDLFGDEELTPIKGQLTVLLPQPEVDYITLAGNLYMFPRKDGILLGGTTERGEWTLNVNEDAKSRILEGHGRFFGTWTPEPGHD